MINEIYEVIIHYIHNRVHLDTYPYYDGEVANEVGIFGASRSILKSFPMVRFCMDRVACAARSKCRPFDFFQFKNDHNVFAYCVNQSSYWLIGPNGTEINKTMCHSRLGIHHIECTFRTCSTVLWIHIIDPLVSNMSDQYVHH